MILAQDKEQTVEKLQQALLDWLADAGNARSTLAGAEGASFVEVLQSILELYNERILQSETDKSLRIDLG